MASRKRHFPSPENSFRKKTQCLKFQEKWKKEFDFIESSERDSSVFCKLCKANFRVAAMTHKWNCSQ